MSIRTLPRRLALLLVPFTVAGVLGWPGVSTAADGRDLAGKAVAFGGRMTYTVPEFLVASELADGGGPVAESFVDTAGKATSFASLPYPGETGIAGPAILGFLAGQNIPFSYPFYARADHPVVGDSHVGDPSGAFDLTAKAADGRASSAARFGSPAGASGPFSGSKATTSAALDDDGVARMTAESVNTLLSFGDGTLRIAAVTSRSVTTLAPGDAKPVTTTHLSIEGVTIGGQAVTIEPDGIHPAGSSSVPLSPPGTTFDDVLAAAGLSVRRVAARDGSAETLVITSVHPLPGTGASGTMMWRFGGAATGITVGGA